MSGKRKATRSCLVCGTKAPQRELTRLVRTVQGSVELDADGKTQGRGAYICTNPSCWEAALAREQLDRALRLPISQETKKRLRAQYARQMCEAVGSEAP